MRINKLTLAAVSALFASCFITSSLADTFTITANDEQQLKIIWKDECPNGKSYTMFFQPYIKGDKAKNMVVCSSNYQFDLPCLALEFASKSDKKGAKAFKEIFDQLMTLNGTQYPFYNYIQKQGTVVKQLPTICPSKNDKSNALEKLKNQSN